MLSALRTRFLIGKSFVAQRPDGMTPQVTAVAGQAMWWIIER